MIHRVSNQNELPVCLEIIHESFKTVAEEFHLTKENCPRHTSFMKLERLEGDFERKTPMFLYWKDAKPVGYFSLERKSEESFELNHLAVLPEFRHLGIGQEMVAYAKQVLEEEYHCRKLQIGIIEESTRLKKWYEKLGFVSVGTRKFEGLLFSVGFMEMSW